MDQIKIIYGSKHYFSVALQKISEISAESQNFRKFLHKFPKKGGGVATKYIYTYFQLSVLPTATHLVETTLSNFFAGQSGTFTINELWFAV